MKHKKIRIVVNRKKFKESMIAAAGILAAGAVYGAMIAARLGM